jgi:hypothetical protein
MDARAHRELGITPDTSDAEAFNSGYNKYTSVIALAVKQR